MQQDSPADSNTSNAAQEELTSLLNGAVEIATDMLEEFGEFEPFALALKTDGEMVHLGTEGHEHDHAEGEECDHDHDPEGVVASLFAMLKRNRTEYKAVAVVADVTLEDDEDEALTAAISIAMEHVDEEPVNCYVPYEIEDDKVELADLVGEPGERLVFFAEPAN